jgi:hypothetical protein
MWARDPIWTVEFAVAEGVVGTRAIVAAKETLMGDHIVATFTARAVATLTRRVALLGFGGAGLAATFKPAPARAGKVGKRAKKACRRQIGQCEGSVSTFCANPFFEDPEACEAVLSPCCQQFKNCKARGAYDCMLAGIAELVSG